MENPFSTFLDAVRRLSRRFRRAAVMGNLAVADIILASPRTLRLSPMGLAYRLFLRSRYVHSMLYLGRGKVLHTTTREGVVVASVPGKIFDRRRYAVFRAPHLTMDERRRVCAEALKLRGRKLDPPALVTNIPARWLGLREPLIRLERNRVWCSRLIQRAYAAAGVRLVPPDLEGTVTSEDLAESPLLLRL